MSTSNGQVWNPIARGVLIIGLGFILLPGCSDFSPEPDVVVVPSPNIPETADAVVRRVLMELQSKDLLPLWVFLPPSYRNDIEQLVQEFGKRLDEKSWEPFVATCRKAHAVTSQLVQRFGEATESATDEDRKIVVALRQMEQFFKALCESDFSDAARIRQLDVHQFLGNTGNQLVAALSFAELDSSTGQSNLFSQLAKVRVELSDSSGDKAVVSVTWPKQEPTQHTFVRVEQHWIPQTLAEAWSVEFPKVREQVLAWADELRGNPEPWHARLGDVDQLLNELAKSQSLDEVRRVGQTGLSRLLVSWLGLTVPDSPKAEPVPVESRPSETPKRIKRPDTEVLLPDDPEQK